MRQIYINNIVLEIPSEKNELSLRQLKSIKKHLLNNPEPNYLSLLLILIDVTRPKVAMYYAWHFIVTPFFWSTWLGYGIMKVLELFGKDVIVNIIRPEVFKNELEEILKFIVDDTPLMVAPFSRKGIFQPFGKYFEGLTQRQFREALFSLLQYQEAKNEADKAEALNESLAWLIAPYWLMWMPFVGKIFRRLYVPKDKPHKRALSIIESLDDTEKVLFFEYYMGNLEKIKAVYSKFYGSDGLDTGKKPSIIQQYYSLKALTQMRSPNGMLDENIELTRFTDILDSYETEIHSTEAREKALEKKK